MRIFFTILLLIQTLFSLAQIDFLPYKIIPVGSSPQVLAIGDINNDGMNDIIIGTTNGINYENDLKIFVFYQNNQGGLHPPINYSYSTLYPGICSMTIADVNNDKLNDVIIGYNEKIGIFFQNSAGLLDPIQSIYSGAGVDGTKCGDLNNDGLLDIVVSHSKEDFIRVFYQSFTGFSSITYKKPISEYNDIDVGDLNGDGLDDVLLTANEKYDGIHVYIQSNSGILNTYVSYYMTNNLISDQIDCIEIGDLNNDGRNDVVASMGGNKPNAKIGIWFQDTVTGLLQNPPYEISAYDLPEPIEIADLNCDNKNEIVTVHGGWMKMSVYEQDSSALYNNYKKIDVTSATHFRSDGLAIGDINNDGNNDIAIADCSHGLVLIINNSKPTQFNIDNTYNTKDTIYKNTLTTSSYFSYTKTYESNNYQYTEVDSFLITNTFFEDSIRIDSIIIKKSEFCAVDYFDTTVISTFYYDINLIHIDTTHLITIKDSLLINDSIIINDSLINSDSINFIKNINIYPNPTLGSIIIELPDPYDEMELKLIIYNDLGELIFQKIFTEKLNIRKLNISSYADGIYFFVLKRGKLIIFNKKIIKSS